MRDIGCVQCNYANGTYIGYGDSMGAASDYRGLNDIDSLMIGSYKPKMAILPVL